MTRRDSLRGLIGLALGSALGGCGLLADRGKLKFRLNVHVATPTGKTVASSVMEAVMTGGAPIYRQINPGTYYVRGEAPWCELAPGKFLFVPLGHPRGDVQMLVALQRFLQIWVGTGSVVDANWRNSFPLARKELPSGNLPTDNYPLMVTFADITKPSTVQRVKLDSFQFVFGSGFALEAVEVEIVSNDTPLSISFAERFPELARHTDFFNPEFVRMRHGEHPEFGLSRSDFIKED